MTVRWTAVRADVTAHSAPDGFPAWHDRRTAAELNPGGKTTGTAIYSLSASVRQRLGGFSGSKSVSPERIRAR